MRKVALAILILFVFAGPAAAESTKGGYAACVSEDLFNQVISAITKKDERGFQYLMDNGCVMLQGGLALSVLDRSWTGVAKIRVYSGNDAMIVWTNTENIVQ